jgi:protein-S-isoprenylcysteine O-methyltransferase Ste14
MTNDRVGNVDRNVDRVGDPGDTTASRLFDLRTLIGALFVLYGLILFIAGLFDSDAEIARSNGIRINIWLGLAMFVLGALFLLWVRLRPLRISTGPSAAEQAGIAEGPAE